MNCCIIIHEVLRLNIKLEPYNYKRSWKMQIWELTRPNPYNKLRFHFSHSCIISLTFEFLKFSKQNQKEIFL
jgi:hypothetical protein